MSMHAKIFTCYNTNKQYTVHTATAYLINEMAVWLSSLVFDFDVTVVPYVASPLQQASLTITVDDTMSIILRQSTSTQSSYANEIELTYGRPGGTFNTARSIRTSYNTASDSFSISLVVTGDRDNFTLTPGAYDNLLVTTYIQVGFTHYVEGDARTTYAFTGNKSLIERAYGSSFGVMTSFLLPGIVRPFGEVAITDQNMVVFSGTALPGQVENMYSVQGDGRIVTNGYYEIEGDIYYALDPNLLWKI